MAASHTSRLSLPLTILALTALVGACQAGDESGLDGSGADTSAAIDSGAGTDESPDTSEGTEDSAVIEDTAVMVDATRPTPDTGPSDDTSEDEDAEEEAVPDTVEHAEVTQVTGWCEAGLGGAGGTRPLAQDIARAHVGPAGR